MGKTCVLAGFSRLLFAPGFSRGARGMRHTKHSALQRASHLALALALKPWLKPSASTLKRAKKGKICTSYPPAEAGGKEEPAEAG